MNKKQITGIILCGGKSIRMGQNKALMRLDNIPLVEIAINKLKKICDRILISTNSPELDYLPYQKVTDKIEGIGPIAGVYSSLHQSETEHNLIITCDTPFVSSEIMEYLFLQSAGYDIVLPEFKGKLQSLTGYFNRSLLDFIEQEINSEHYKPILMFQQSKLNVIKIDETDKDFGEHLFFNINSMDDFQEASRILANISK